MVDRKALEIEADRILDALGKAGLTLRLVGSMAILRRCPNHAVLASSERAYRDIDFAGRKKESRDIHELLTRLGYIEDREVFVVSEGARAIFASASNGVHVDVFYEKLDFCHAIPLAPGFRSIRPRFRWPSFCSASCRSSRSPRRTWST